MVFRHKSIDADFFVVVEGINFIKDSEVYLILTKIDLNLN